MNYGHLYKYKNIHNFYRTTDDIWHIESFPIIYMNQSVVYFKRPGMNELDYVINETYTTRWKVNFDQEAKNSILIKYRDYILKGSHDYRFNGGYYLNVDLDDVKEFFSEIEDQAYVYTLKSQIKDYEDWLSTKGAVYERRIQEFKEKLNKLYAEVKELEGGDAHDQTDLIETPNP